MSLNYKDAGVDVEAGDNLVEWLKQTASPNPPFAERLISGIGGFAAVFRMGFPDIKKPCLVASTDGVGTKIKLASEFASYAGAGQDLVAMCVNDLVCCGARPLFFLDYYASGKLDLAAAKEFLGGVRKACEYSGCALIGGETAEMPGLYHGRDFDAAGFAIGVVDEDRILGPKRVQVGDKVIGVSSSGFHSNGYSLLRKVFADDLEKWRESLLVPTHLYPPLVAELMAKTTIHAIANITGGGMENVPRVLPKGTKLPLVDWSWPEMFGVVQDRTSMSRVEMLQTLNCGVGLVLVLPPEAVGPASRIIEAQGYKAIGMGTVEKAAADRDAEVEY